ncbi:MAG TPA: WGR domain-containing protein, partial [Puia sp.]|nr:WGR domain-containing protein [Puia sp.]
AGIAGAASGGAGIAGGVAGIAGGAAEAAGAAGGALGGGLTGEQNVDPAGMAGANSGIGAAGLYDHLVFRRLVSGEADAARFWEAATDGNKLVTRWGKAGMRAQTQLKTFPDEEAARKEQQRQEKEQLAKGFRPVE